ncbi:cation diffusion facilitator family transporter [Sphingomonas morindae]|uniref:Cation diffusion facilitator family transporter n=1 Tax=Sphingomonas morindae TaxID=1541170 RepID=A0ABY4X3H5_9SPHN|nr:cation diffusion facilitator family transporter [Sphingomonas morindae]USI71426.1 cation diffusion facilitator family transporter [Sphingomonas morindae]
MNAEAGAHLPRRAAIASSSLALALLALKGWGVVASGSVAMLGSLADTALDLLASLVTLWGVHIAGQRADDDHRFGHGKAESLAALFQVALILVSAVAIAIRAAAALRGGAAAVAAETGMIVSLVAALATLVLLAYQRRVIARTRSVAIQADHVHYQSDLLLNGAVIVALGLEAWLGWRGADAVFALLIAGWLGWGALGTGRRAVDDLMDREWPAEKRRAFLGVAGTIPALAGMHDLRTRTSGARDFAQFHMTFPPDTTIASAHRVIAEVEAQLVSAFPGLEVIIHAHPAGHVDPERDLPSAIAERSEL